MVHYTEKNVKILDAQMIDEVVEGQNDFHRSIYFMLQDIEEEKIFSCSITEEQIQSLLGLETPLTSTQLINFIVALRSRQDPVKLVIPDNAEEITIQDIVRKAPPRKRRRKPKNVA